MSSQDQDDFSDSDRQWLAAVSGNGVDPASAAAREGFALRTALEQLDLERAAPADAAQAPESEAQRRARRDALLQRAIAEGAFERPPRAGAAATAPTPPLPATTQAAPTRAPASRAAPPSNVVGFPWWRRRRVALALAASLALGSVLVTQLLDRPTYGPPPELLGTPANVQRLQAARPRAEAERLAAQLRAAGLRPGLYQRGATYIVDLTLLASELPTAAPAFEPLAIRPAAGFNRVEFAAR
jgi:hypothetical protein